MQDSYLVNYDTIPENGRLKKSPHFNPTTLRGLSTTAPKLYDRAVEWFDLGYDYFHRTKFSQRIKRPP